MKVKICEAVTCGGLEKQVNKFISQDGIRVLELQHAHGGSVFSVMIVYEGQSPKEE